MGKLISQVTSLVEVWIEILPIQVIGTFPLRHFPCGSVDWNIARVQCLQISGRHFPCGSVDWNRSAWVRMALQSRHFPCGSVDWNESQHKLFYHICSHFPCGSVDWNYSWHLHGTHKWVTSLVEVWIEIPMPCIKVCESSVTSLVEVWIEILTYNRIVGPGFGHFPCGSVDWNNDNTIQYVSLDLSLPLWKCGLKFWWCASRMLCDGHFPCGSVDWNVPMTNQTLAEPGHFPCGSVDWNIKEGNEGFLFTCHFPCGSVDWNYDDDKIFDLMDGHFPCGSVDWNNGRTFGIALFLPVTSLVEVWIEIPVVPHASDGGSVTSLVEVWIEIVSPLPPTKKAVRHFPCGSVDWNQNITMGKPSIPVTSLVEVWIEIKSSCLVSRTSLSLPLWKCGLKYSAIK